MPNLLWPLTITIEPTPEVPLDEEFREPTLSEDEIKKLALDGRFRVKAQMFFNQFNQANMKFSGDDEDTRARAVIRKRAQRKYKIKAHWRIVEIIERDGTVTSCDFRISEVRPKAQRGTFGLYYLFFEDLARA